MKGQLIGAMTPRGPYQEHLEARLRECEARIAKMLPAPNQFDPKAEREEAEQLNSFLAVKDILLEKLAELERACGDARQELKAAARHARIVLQHVFDHAGPISSNPIQFHR